MTDLKKSLPFAPLTPCGECAHFDENAMLRAGKPTSLGWCAKLSVYPAVDAPGKTAPIGVRRAPPGELPRPQVKARAMIVAKCSFVTKKTAAAPRTRAELLAKAKGGS